MSRQIQYLVDEDQVDQVLQHLDSGSEHEICGLPPTGPFMVFRAHDAATPGTPIDPLPSAQPAGNPPSSGVEDILNPQVADTLIPDPIPSSLELLDDILADVDIDKELSLDFPSFCVVPSSSHADVAQIASPSPLDLHLQHGLIDDFQASVSTHAHFLLEHYKSQMGKLFSPLRARKSPWSILHFPRALSALAELSIFKTTKHAHTSLFYSVLAVSAFNWDNIQQEQKDSTTYWRNIGEGFRRGAKKQLEWTCETELAGEKSSKYKDILMAILTMVTISVSTPLPPPSEWILG
ncbi:hypothetical protein TPAR_01465 [Tolypocladium paradoxum]|uniref:Uncharacterized protein n=1 Tax=Tolypocladium paradoxum TaxID=94208 RepID=A0A2S4L7D1_9HYPO|nr:hypothetical protein TPAR_01465 [Tolypocladium paradoxum]